MDESRAARLDRLCRIASRQGGRLLSTSYKNAVSKLDFECAKGHRFSSRASHVTSGSWCPFCAREKAALTRRKYGPVDALKIAKNKGAKLRSKGGFAVTDKLDWTCSEGHDFSMALAKINQGSWCPRCGANRRGGMRLVGLDACKELAKTRGGQCISSKYVSARDDLEWQCGLGHRWNAAQTNVKRGTWCPTCKAGLSEGMCREALSKYLNVELKKVRPDWLRWEDYPLELDGYNEKAKIAIEVQGEQHSRHIGFFHKSAKALKEQKARDAFKLRECRARGIELIRIYVSESQNRLEMIYRGLVQGLKKSGLEVSEKRLRAALSTGVWTRRDRLEEVRELIESRGGKLLSKEYLGARERVEYICDKGHRAESVVSNLRTGQWCYKCGRTLSGEKQKVQNAVEQLSKLARKKGGKFLNTSYVNTSTPHDWSCSEGHKFRAKPGAVKRGAWCPYCAGKRKTIETLKMSAKARGGECLSTVYRGTAPKYKWRCAKGHEWSARASNVLRGVWCPRCGFEKVSELRKSKMHKKI